MCFHCGRETVTTDEMASPEEQPAEPTSGTSLPDPDVRIYIGDPTEFNPWKRTSGLFVVADSETWRYRMHR